MEEKKVGALFEEIKDDLANYVSDRLRLFKLQTYAKTSKSGAALIYTVVAILLILFAINFVFITLALFLGEILGSIALGFAIVSLFTIVVVTIIIMTRKSIRRRLTNKILSSLINDDKE